MDLFSDAHSNHFRSQEGESKKKFVPDAKFSFDVGRCFADQSDVNFDPSAPIVFPTRVQVGQRLVIDLPPTSTVPNVQYDTGALGAYNRVPHASAHAEQS